jgi:ubiquinol-cytochrome c reductase iron-sulfur subunit
VTSSALKPELNRRDFLFVSTAGMATVGAAATAWPLVQQMNPAADLASVGTLTVDLTHIEPGQQVILRWRGMPIFVVRRTSAIMDELKSPQLLERLRDPVSAELQQPGYAQNWARALNPEYLVLVGVCTHLACIPSFSPERGSLASDMPGGWLCHCHGSRYDMAGRVYKGVPAPFNLPVPPHHFADGKTLVIGENPDGETFDIGEVNQL